MNINELRFGNIILLGKTDVPTFKDIKYEEVILSYKELRQIYSNPLLYDFKGVPLTLNIIKKSRFRNYSGFYVHKLVLLHYYKGIITFKTDHSHVKLNYVHELQNLYFDLNKKEMHYEK